MNLRSVGVLCILFLVSRVSGGASGFEPTGRLMLVSVFINEFLQEDRSKAANLTLTCSTRTFLFAVDMAYGICSL